MSFKFTIEVEVERVSGKFASKDEIADQIREALDSADPGTISNVGADSDSEYEVVNWSVED